MRKLAFQCSILLKLPLASMQLFAVITYVAKYSVCALCFYCLMPPSHFQQGKPQHAYRSCLPQLLSLHVWAGFVFPGMSSVCESSVGTNTYVVKHFFGNILLVLGVKVVAFCIIMDNYKIVKNRDLQSQCLYKQTIAHCSLIVILIWNPSQRMFFFSLCVSQVFSTLVFYLFDCSDNTFSPNHLMHSFSRTLAQNWNGANLEICLVTKVPGH